MREIYELLCMGKSRSDIWHFVAENYQLSERQADRLIAEARKLLLNDCELTRPMYLAESLGRLRTYENAAAKRGQLKVAVESVALQAKLVGLDK